MYTSDMQKFNMFIMTGQPHVPVQTKHAGIRIKRTDYLSLNALGVQPTRLRNKRVK